MVYQDRIETIFSIASFIIFEVKIVVLLLNRGKLNC